jgi:SAM-dependent methyltransferase
MMGIKLTDLNISNDGFCHTCRKNSKFESNDAWLRDNYFCLKCGSVPRQRHIQWILDKYFPGWEGLNIHESSPSNSFIAQYSSCYSSSQFLANIPFGETAGGIRCESLEQLTYGDNTFDIFVTQDVLEHVFNPDVAVREIVRVLKAGGIHIFTAPKHMSVKESYPRAIVGEGGVVYLRDEQYHGNPVGDGRSLVTWDYGSDFECLLTTWSGCPLVTYVTRDRSVGLDGEYLEVFVMRKI